MSRVMFGFELLTDAGWSSEACGHQGPDNYFSTQSEAIAELPALARVLECGVQDLRVVPVEVQS